MEQAKFTYRYLRNTQEKQTKKPANALKSLHFYTKRVQLRRIESIFPKNQLNDWIIAPKPNPAIFDSPKLTLGVRIRNVYQIIYMKSIERRKKR